MIAPAATPKHVVALLNQEVNRALMLPDVRDKLAAFGLEVHTESPEYFTDVIRRDFEKWGKLARDVGFKPR
jgi:tripartite-type tricarboxylate transporter receptor subunit TctC